MTDAADPALPATLAPPDAVLDRAVDAALVLAADKPWNDITLRDIAVAAAVPFAALYARAPGKAALFDRLCARHDAAALKVVEGDDQAKAHDRLFEVFMARLEVMHPQRDVILAVARAEGVAVGPFLPRTARALAEAAGVDTSGPVGGLRLVALTAVWARVLQVWRDDEGALNRTMAEIDKRLKETARRLARLNAAWD
jgi:AcrR family transcriptional regulator